MKATDAQIQVLAENIAMQSAALASSVWYSNLNDTEIHARALLIQDNVATLVAWTKEN